jgi:hypothetical protein
MRGGRRGATGATAPKRKAIPYPPMTLDAIKALPVSDLADDPSRLFLWTTNRFLPESFNVLASWGFRYAQTLVWAKRAPSPFGGSVAPKRCGVLARRGARKAAGCCSRSTVGAGRTTAAALGQAGGVSRSRRTRLARPVSRDVRAPEPSRLGHMGRPGARTRGDGLMTRQSERPTFPLYRAVRALRGAVSPRRRRSNLFTQNPCKTQGYPRPYSTGGVTDDRPRVPSPGPGGHLCVVSPSPLSPYSSFWFLLAQSARAL